MWLSENIRSKQTLPAAYNLKKQKYHCNYHHSKKQKKTKKKSCYSIYGHFETKCEAQISQTRFFNTRDIELGYT